MLKFSQLITKGLKTTSRPLILVRPSNYTTTAAIVAETKAQQANFEQSEPRTTRPQNTIVAAAFASLQDKTGKETNELDIKTPLIDQKLNKAETVAELLSISEGNGISRRFALRVVSILADWTSGGRAKLADFEADPRFIKICRVLTKSTAKSRNLVSRSEDLHTILNVTADDEAARLVESITLPQMVKVMSTLSAKKRRSTLLLRSLAYNIAGSGEALDLKQSADLLYSVCILNFYDENLVAKITTDVCSALQKDLKKSSVVGSIITSLGLLKHKNPELLDSLAEWMVENEAICRQQDLFSLLQTLAVLDHMPPNADKIFQTLAPAARAADVESSVAWLDLVWSLVLLRQATCQHVESVLNADFVNSIEGKKNLSPATKMKMLNVNGAAQILLDGYKGPLLPETSGLHNVEISRSKGKTEIAESVIGSLRNLIQNETNLKTNINTGLGFNIDAKILLDKKGVSLPLDASNELNPETTKVAFLVFEYHDMCRGKITPTGIHQFASRVLEAQGYKVVPISYVEYRPRDKLVHRVQFLESKLKQLAQ